MECFSYVDVIYLSFGKWMWTWVTFCRVF